VSYRLDWRGSALLAVIKPAVIAAVTEFGLRHETASKSSPQPNRGIVTATYQRSIHAASPDYDFASDNVTPARDTPERAGTGGGAVLEGSKVQVRVGSGMEYAGALEKRYGFIQAGHDQVAPLAPEILERHVAPVVNR